MKRTSSMLMLAAGSMLGLASIPVATAWQPTTPPSRQPTQPPAPPPNKPGQANDPNQPGRGTPGQPTPDSPSSPRTPGVPFDTNPDGTRDGQNGTGRNTQRPFTFQNPNDEARFNQSAQQLVRMEQKMKESNQALLKRLGEIRSMPQERQNAATMDLLQQLLQNQAEMGRYLVDARTLWTGDVQMSGQEQGSQNQPGMNDPLHERQMQNGQNNQNNNNNNNNNNSNDGSNRTRNTPPR